MSKNEKHPTKEKNKIRHCHRCDPIGTQVHQLTVQGHAGSIFCLTFSSSSLTFLVHLLVLLLFISLNALSFLTVPVLQWLDQLFLSYFIFLFFYHWYLTLAPPC